MCRDRLVTVAVGLPLLLAPAGLAYAQPAPGGVEIPATAASASIVRPGGDALAALCRPRHHNGAYPYLRDMDEPICEDGMGMEMLRPQPQASASSKAQEDLPTALKSGSLLIYGLTGGIAGGVQIPLGGSPAKVDAVAPVAVPYVMLAPRFLFGSHDANAICARALAVDSTDISKAAVVQFSARQSGGGPIHRETVYAALQSTDPNVQNDVADALKAADGHASCSFLHRLGLYGGVPSSFQVNTTIDGFEGSRSVRPLVSFGLGYIPHPWIHILLGLTYSNVTTDGGTTTPSGGKVPGFDDQVWSLFFGVGGPLDIASAFGGGGGGGGGKGS
jgi:hypothetical protein